MESSSRHFECKICALPHPEEEMLPSGSYGYDCWADYMKTRYHYKKANKPFNMVIYKRARRAKGLPTAKDMGSGKGRGRPRKAIPGFSSSAPVCRNCKLPMAGPRSAIDRRICRPCGTFYRKMAGTYSFLTVDHMLALSDADGFEWEDHLLHRRMINAFIDETGEHFTYDDSKEE
jgi:hypothetical protein